MHVHGSLRQQRVPRLKCGQYGLVLLQSKNPGVLVFEFHTELRRNRAVTFIEKRFHQPCQNAVSGLLRNQHVELPVLIDWFASRFNLLAHGIERSMQCLDGGGCDTAGRQDDSCPFKCGPRLHQLRWAFSQRFRAGARFWWLGRDVNARSHSDLDTSINFQGYQGLTQGGARNAQSLCQFTLRRQPRTRRKLAAVNQLTDLVGDLLIKPAGLQSFGLTNH